MLCSCWDVPPPAFFSVSRNLNIQYFAILDFDFTPSSGSWLWSFFFVLLLFHWKVIDKHYYVCFVFLVKVFINFFLSSSSSVIEPLRSERPRPRPPSQPFLSDCVHARHISSHSVESLSLNRRSLTARGDQEFKRTKHSLWARWRCRKSQRIAFFTSFVSHCYWASEKLVIPCNFSEPSNLRVALKTHYLLLFNLGVFIRNH